MYLTWKKKFILTSNPKKIEVFDFHNIELHDQTSLEYLFKNDFMINLDDLYCHVYISDELDYNKIYTSYYDNTYKGKTNIKFSDLSNRQNFLSSETPLKEQVLHNFASHILKAVDKGEISSRTSLREKIDLYVSRDLIEFQNKKLIYLNIIDYIDEKLRFIDELEGK